MNRRHILAILLGVLALCGLLGLKTWLGSQQTIVVVTDSPPISLRLGSKSFTVSTSRQTIRLPKGVYNYGASHNLAGDNIVLYGSVNNSGPVQATIVLNYRIFTKQYIKQSLCRLDGVSPDNCSSLFTPQRIVFTADHSWAVVTLTPSEELDSSYDVLQLQEGQWQKVAGPADAADLQGLVPDSVLGVMGQ